MKVGCVFSEKLSRGKVHGEDARPYASNNMVAVADGLGGRGPEQYRDIETGEIYTSAYIGANTVLETIQSISQDELTIDSIKNAILQGLNQAREKYEKVGMGISSSMFKIFPTTMAIGYVDDNNLLHAFWCGDSRVYVLNAKKGLTQISRDDLADETLDPLTNIVESGQMSQYVSLSSDFAINESTYQLERENTIVFAASDGAFDYFESPMHFEMFLLKTIQSVASFDEFVLELQKGLVKISGDDISVGLVFMGSDLYANWKLSIQDRFKELNRDLAVVEEKKKMLSENSKMLNNIQAETNEVLGRIVSTESAQIVKKILEKQLTEVQEKTVRRVLPETLTQKVDKYIEDTRKIKTMLRELENMLLMEMAKDYLNREQFSIRIWTNEYRYRELLTERGRIKSAFEEIVDELTEMEKVLTNKLRIVTNDLLQEKPINEDNINRMKNIFNEFMVIVYQGGIFGKLAKRKEKCERAIIKLCQSVVEKNKNTYKNFLYRQELLPFTISDSTRNLMEVFNQRLLEGSILNKSAVCLEKELSDCLSNMSIYEDILVLFDGVNFSSINELREKEVTYIKQNADYEEQIQMCLKEVWDSYRKNYEYYEMCA